MAENSIPQRDKERGCLATALRWFLFSSVGAIVDLVILYLTYPQSDSVKDGFHQGVEFGISIVALIICTVFILNKITDG